MEKEKNIHASALAKIRHQKNPRTPEEIAKMSKAGVDARKKKRELEK